MRRSVFLGLLLAFSLLLFAAPAELRKIAMINLPGTPGFDGLAFVNGVLVIGHTGAGTVDIFDPQKRRIVTQVKDVGEVKGIAADGKSGTVFAASSSGKRVFVISAKDWTITDTVPLGTEPYDLALSSDGATLFSANWRNQSISKIDVAHGFKIHTVQVGGTPCSVVYDPEARIVYASLDDQGEIIGLDGNLNVVRRIKLTASQPTGLALDAAARRLYVAVRHAVVAVQIDTGVEVGRLAAPIGANALLLDRGSGTLYVGSADGTITLMLATGSRFQPLGEVRTDVRGSTLAYDEQKGLLLMPGGFEGKSELLIMKRVETTQAGMEKPK